MNCVNEIVLIKFENELQEMLKKEVEFKVKDEFIERYIHRGLSKKYILDRLNLAKSTYYDNKNRIDKEKIFNSTAGEKIPISKIEELVMGYLLLNEKEGYRKIADKINKEYMLEVKRSKMYEIVKKVKLQMEDKALGDKYKSLMLQSSAEKVNEIWEFDMRAIYINEEEGCLYLVICCDIYDQFILGYQVAYTLSSVNYIEVLERVLEYNIRRQIKKISLNTVVKPMCMEDEFQEKCRINNIRHRIINTYEERAFEAINFIYKKIENAVREEIPKSKEQMKKLIIDIIDNHNNERVAMCNDISRKNYRQVMKVLAMEDRYVIDIQQMVEMFVRE